jgi:ABC-type uncharacterized transport system permease subunit
MWRNAYCTAISDRTSLNTTEPSVVEKVVESVRGLITVRPFSISFFLFPFLRYIHTGHTVPMNIFENMISQGISSKISLGYLHIFQCIYKSNPLVFNVTVNVTAYGFGLISLALFVHQKGKGTQQYESSFKNYVSSTFSYIPIPSPLLKIIGLL